MALTAQQLVNVTVNWTMLTAQKNADYRAGNVTSRMRHHNITVLQWLNSISQERIKLLRDMYSPSTSNFDKQTLIALIAAFTILIFIGAFGNGLVCFVVARRPHMRTPRNIFITNLAISDLTLCLFTQPFNLMKCSMLSWPFGEFLCKFVPMAAATNVIVSTMSITAIALDRFQVIVYPTRKDTMRTAGAALALGSIWGVSLLMASPLFLFNGLQPFPPKSSPIGNVTFYYVCAESEEYKILRTVYSFVSIILQYILPIVVVSVAHGLISRKLKNRMVNRQQQQKPQQQQQQQLTNTTTTTTLLRHNTSEDSADATGTLRKKRERKTNLLLIMIALIFVLSWLPLNVTNIVAEFNMQLLQSSTDEALLFAMCNLFVLLSACLNAVIYGWLNDNFRAEFLAIFARCLPAGCCVTARQGSPNERSTFYRATSGVASLKTGTKQTDVKATTTITASPLVIANKKVNRYSAADDCNFSKEPTNKSSL